MPPVRHPALRGVCAFWNSSWLGSARGTLVCLTQPPILQLHIRRCQIFRAGPSYVCCFPGCFPGAVFRSLCVLSSRRCATRRLCVGSTACLCSSSGSALSLLGGCTGTPHSHCAVFEPCVQFSSPCYFEVPAAGLGLGFNRITWCLHPAHWVQQKAQQQGLKGLARQKCV